MAQTPAAWMWHVSSPSGRAAGAVGFTVVEVMVAVLLIGVGLMALASVSTSVTRANAQSSALTVAGGLAQERIETLRSAPYASIASGGDERDLDRVTYRRTWNVADDQPRVGLKTILVTVTWTSRGVARRTTLATIRSSR
jgi:type IV pilus assembly protein PilV